MFLNSIFSISLLGQLPHLKNHPLPTQFKPQTPKNPKTIQQQPKQPTFFNLPKPNKTRPIQKQPRNSKFTTNRKQFVSAKIR